MGRKEKKRWRTSHGGCQVSLVIRVLSSHTFVHDRTCRALFLPWLNLTALGCGPKRGDRLRRWGEKPSLPIPECHLHMLKARQTHQNPICSYTLVEKWDVHFGAHGMCGFTAMEMAARFSINASGGQEGCGGSSSSAPSPLRFFPFMFPLSCCSVGWSAPAHSCSSAKWPVTQSLRWSPNFFSLLFFWQSGGNGLSTCFFQNSKAPDGRQWPLAEVDWSDKCLQKHWIK